jgi:hypothetical protein
MAQILIGSDWQNVKSFGAKGDGINDDTGAIQAAMNAGSQVYFPAGTYIVNQLTLSNAKNAVLWGYGATLKKKAGSVTWTRILDITNSDTVKILGLTLDGNKPNVAGSPHEGCGSIFATGLKNFTYQDLKICNSYYGVSTLTNCHYGRISNCIFDDIDVGILGMNTANSNITIENCLFSNGTSEGVSFGIYTPTTPEEFKKIGYHDHITIQSCRFINKNGNCIQLRNARNFYISDNYFERTDKAKSTMGIAIDPTAVKEVTIYPSNIVIQSNQIKGMKYEGVLVTNGANIIIKDNLFDSMSSFNILVTGTCIIKNNIFTGIQAKVPNVIYIKGNNVKTIDNYVKLDSVKVTSVIGVGSATAGIEIIDNVLSKNSGNASTGIGLDNTPANACIISGNIGF